MFHHPVCFNVGQQRYTREKELGRGAFGCVFLVKNRYGEKFALKDIPTFSPDCIEATQTEINLLRKVEHENIVKLHEFDIYGWEDIIHVCLLLEYCSGGTLNEALRRKPSDTMNLIWMTQLSNAVDYLHQHGVIHRDLKPENVLLDDYSCIKLGDFGLARLISFIKAKDKTTDDWIAAYIECYQQTCVGTPHWMAPEVYDHHYSHKADVFSLGVLFYAICERSYITAGNERYYGAFVPYGNRMVGIGNVYAEIGPSVEVEFSLTGTTRALRELIKDMLDCYPMNRPNCSNVKCRIERIAKTFSRISLVDDFDPPFVGGNSRQVPPASCCLS